MPGSWPNTPEEILAQLLVDLGIAVFPPVPNGNGNWGIADSAEPDSPDNFITIYRTTSVLHGRLNITGEIPSHNGFQVRIRSRTNNIGLSKGEDIAFTLDQVIYRNVVTIDQASYCVHSFSRTSGVTYIGKDAPKTQRSLHTINGIAWIVSL